MTERLAPGVYIEEVQFASSPIQGVSTSTVGFVAVTGRGPLLGPLFSFLDFERVATPNLGENSRGRCAGFSRTAASNASSLKSLPPIRFKQVWWLWTREQFQSSVAPTIRPFRIRQ
jgi:phage tail sheath protein FI